MLILNVYYVISNIWVLEDESAKKIVQQCIHRNTFYAYPNYPENIILAEISSSHEAHCIDAVKTVIEARAKIRDEGFTLRSFLVPLLGLKHVS